MCVSFFFLLFFVSVPHAFTTDSQTVRISQPAPVPSTGVYVGSCAALTRRVTVNERGTKSHPPSPPRAKPVKLKQPIGTVRDSLVSRTQAATRSSRTYNNNLIVLLCVGVFSCVHIHR